MKTSFSVGGLALASAAFLLSACGTPDYRYSYYERPYYYSSAYDDCYGRYYRAPYCIYPSFSGTVVIEGTPYRGRYRNGPYGREFWHDGRWVRT